MPYTNIPPSLQDIHEKLNDRLNKKESANRFTAPVYETNLNGTLKPAFFKNSPVAGDVFVTSTTDIPVSGNFYDPNDSSLWFQTTYNYPSLVWQVPTQISTTTEWDFTLATSTGGANEFVIGTTFTIADVVSDPLNYFNDSWLVTGKTNATDFSAVRIGNQTSTVIPTSIGESGTIISGLKPVKAARFYEPVLLFPPSGGVGYGEYPIYLRQNTVFWVTAFTAGEQVQFVLGDTCGDSMPFNSSWTAKIYIRSGYVDLPSGFKWTPAAPSTNSSGLIQGYNITILKLDDGTLKKFVSWEQYV